MSGVEDAVDQDAADAVQVEIDALVGKKSSKVSTLMKADNFLRHVLLHSRSGDPNIMVRRIMRTSSSDSDVVTGLEIWRHMAVTYAGSAQTRVVTLLKQIMTPTERNPEKSTHVFKCIIIGANSSASVVTQFREDSVEHQDHVSTSKCSWSSCQCSFPQHQREVDME